LVKRPARLEFLLKFFDTVNEEIAQQKPQGKQDKSAKTKLAQKELT